VARVDVDVSRARARRGDPTARWVAETMPQSVIRALGPRFVRGAPGGAVLTVQVDDVRLMPVRLGAGPRIIDEITGSVSLSARGGPPRRRSIRATATFRPAARDIPMRVEANRRRVVLLVERFAAHVPRELSL
jgi:hypothetical protein